jgi:hypothetical protein
VPVVVVEDERADAERAGRRRGRHQRDHRGELLAERLADEVIAQQERRVAERLRAAGLGQELVTRSDVLADHAEPESPPLRHLPSPTSAPCGPLWPRLRPSAGGFRTSRWRSAGTEASLAQVESRHGGPARQDGWSARARRADPRSPSVSPSFRMYSPVASRTGRCQGLVAMVRGSWKFVSSPWYAGGVPKVHTSKRIPGAGSRGGEGPARRVCGRVRRPWTSPSSSRPSQRIC